jgi:LysM repeat protein
MTKLGRLNAALILAISMFLAGCTDRSAPTPVVTSTASSPAAKQVYVVVQRGQSLDQIARSFLVPKADIIAANNLAPPYSVKPGATLVIPGAASQFAENPLGRPKSAAPIRAATKPDRVAAAQNAPQPPKSKQAAPEAKATLPQVIPLD